MWQTLSRIMPRYLPHRLKTNARPRGDSRTLATSRFRHEPVRSRQGQADSGRQSVDLRCPEVARGCQGCTVHKGLNSPPVLAKARAAFADYGINLTSTFLSAHGWRTRVRLAVRGRAGSKAINIGLFKPGTHDVYPLLGCPLHHPRINDALQLLHRKLKQWAVQPYIEVPLQKRSKRVSGEQQSRGLLRYVQLTVCADHNCADDSGALVQVVCVVNCGSDDKRATSALSTALAELWADAGPASTSPLLHSIWINFQQAAGNSILGDKSLLLHGNEWAWQQYNGTLVAISPTSFVQANNAAMTAVLQCICDAVPPNAHVIDLHAGIGPIGLSILNNQRIASLTCVEVNGSGKIAFERSLKQLGVAKQRVPTRYHICAAGDVPAAVLAAADVIVVDPPRKGLEASLARSLCVHVPEMRHAAERNPITIWNAAAQQQHRGDVAEPFHGLPRGLVSEDASSVATVSSGISAASECVSARDKDKAQTLIYLSCGFQALQRDLGVLQHQGSWQISSAHAFVFFPGVDAIETLVILRRERIVRHE